MTRSRSADGRPHSVTVGEVNDAVEMGVGERPVHRLWITLVVGRRGGPRAGWRTGGLAPPRLARSRAPRPRPVPRDRVVADEYHAPRIAAQAWRSGDPGRCPGSVGAAINQALIYPEASHRARATVAAARRRRLPETGRHRDLPTGRPRRRVRRAPTDTPAAGVLRATGEHGDGGAGRAPPTDRAGGVPSAGGPVGVVHKPRPQPHGTEHLEGEAPPSREAKPNSIVKAGVRVREEVRGAVDDRPVRRVCDGAARRTVPDGVPCWARRTGSRGTPEPAAETRRPPPGGRAGVAVRSGSGGVEPVPFPREVAKST